jgi:TrpR family transcriptional regulator, trp operon repressor
MTGGSEPMEDFRELIGIMSKIDSQDEMEKFFNEIFTTKEKYDLALRWRLMKDLFHAIPQREIAHNLGISLCKITRGSKILKQEGSMCKRLIADLQEEPE